MLLYIVVVMENFAVGLNEPEFVVKVNEIINKYDIQQVIETGTNVGLGSTLVFAETGLPVTTLECALSSYEQAQKNLSDYPNVSILHAHSLDKELIIKEMPNNFNDHAEMGEEIRRDCITQPYGARSPERRRREQLRFYNHEINHETQYNNILPPLINNTVKQLVFLDSAGGCGFMEFNEFMKMPKRFLLNKVLVMDDVDHVKHFGSFKRLLDMGHNPQKSENGRFGWCSFMLEKGLTK